MSRSGSPARPAVTGCKLEPLDAVASRSFLAWLLGEPGSGVPAGASGLVWALAHCDDGVTWGRFDTKANVWRFGDQTFPQPGASPSPPIRPDRLLELRIFGKLGEILIWPTEEGFRGRSLRELDPPADRKDPNDPLRPSDEYRILRGDHECDCAERGRDCRGKETGFTHIMDRSGAEQVLPIAVTRAQLLAGRARLVVSHYYERDEYGAGRIAASRLVMLTLGDSHGA